MKYSESEIRQYVAEEDIKFLRMTFFDLAGNQKNMSILPDALDRAFSTGIAFDASAIPGFGDELHSDLFLQPDTSTLCLLPWRPDHGRVARLFCRILHSDGTPFEGDSRALLQKAVEIEPDDTPETLQRRVMEQAEWILLPQAAETVCAGLQK